jgi:two-component system, chemotaxis family, CheB/CheR fusion protein
MPVEVAADQLRMKRNHIYVMPVGRLITNLPADVEVPQLEALISEVMETLATREVEVEDRKGHWHNLQIRPYETADNLLTGAVMILLDSHEAKLGADRSKTMVNYAEAFIGIVRSPVIVLDSNLCVKTATARFYETFQSLPKDTEGLSIFDIGSGQWNFLEFRALLEERLLRHLRVTDFECEHESPRLGRKKIRINVRQVDAINPEDRLMIVSVEEVV